MSYRFCGLLFSILITGFLLTSPVSAQYGQTVDTTPGNTPATPPPIVTITYPDNTAITGQVLGASTASLFAAHPTLSTNLGRFLRALANPNSNFDTDDNAGQVLGTTQNTTGNHSGQVLGASTEELPVSGNFLGSVLLGVGAVILIIVGALCIRRS